MISSLTIISTIFSGWIFPISSGWMATEPSSFHCHARRRYNQSPSSFSSPGISPTVLFAALPEGYQEFGEHVIRKAGEQCGVEKEEDLTIEWKAGKIVVTVHGQVYVSVEREEEAEDMEDDSVEDDLLESTVLAENDSDEESKPPRGVDVTALARAINAALDDDGIGLMIAEVHEIEVTTPGASEELRGPTMFEAYRGFDVICQQQDPKTQNTKTIEGRLVERNDEFTIVNVKGRMKKMKNESVLSVRLPKAKTEKGGRK